jgi:hypothetical protein
MFTSPAWLSTELLHPAQNLFYFYFIGVMLIAPGRFSRTYIHHDRGRFLLKKIAQFGLTQPILL